MPINFVPNQHHPRQVGPPPYRDQFIFRDEDFPQLPPARCESPTGTSNEEEFVSPFEGVPGLPFEDPPKSNSEPERTFHRFLELPDELQLSIWEDASLSHIHLAVEGRNYVNVRDSARFHNKSSFPMFLPDFCYVSKQEKKKTIEAFMRVSYFMVASINGNTFFRGFLAGAEGRAAKVHRLNFDYFGRCPRGVTISQDLELAFTCTDLRTIHINMHTNEITHWSSSPYDDDDNRCPFSAQSLFNRYHFGRLLDCNHLRKVQIFGSGSNWNAARTALGEMIQEKFAEKVSTHVIEIEHLGY